MVLAADSLPGRGGPADELPRSSQPAYKDKVRALSPSDEGAGTGTAAGGIALSLLEPAAPGALAVGPYGELMHGPRMPGTLAADVIPDSASTVSSAQMQRNRERASKEPKNTRRGGL